MARTPSEDDHVKGTIVQSSKLTLIVLRRGQFSVIAGLPRSSGSHCGGWVGWGGIRGQYQSISQARPSFPSGRNVAGRYFAASQPASFSLRGGQGISEHEPRHGIRKMLFTTRL